MRTESNGTSVAICFNAELRPASEKVLLKAVMRNVSIVLAASIFATGCGTNLKLANYSKLVDAEASAALANAAEPKGNVDEGAKAEAAKLEAAKAEAARQARISALRLDFADAQKVCTETLDSMYVKFTGSGNREITLAVVGIVAGSVIVPALAAKATAAKSAIAGWGGVAGAANAAQLVLHDKGASAAAIAEVYEDLRADIILKEGAYFAAKDEDAIRDAVAALSSTCSYKPLPSAKAPVAVTTTTTTNTTNPTTTTENTPTGTKTTTTGGGSTSTTNTSTAKK